MTDLSNAKDHGEPAHLNLGPMVGDPGYRSGGDEEAKKRDEIVKTTRFPPETKRVFATGASRDTAAGKIDYEGHLSPLAIEAYGTYMNYNRVMRDGTQRASDNWQKGIPQEAYIKSGWRHTFDWWKFHRGLAIKENIVWALCGVLFNASGYLHELLREDPTLLARSLQQMEAERAKRS